MHLFELTTHRGSNEDEEFLIIQKTIIQKTSYKKHHTKNYQQKTIMQKTIMQKTRVVFFCDFIQKTSCYPFCK